jgi:hypothetical protein
MRSVHPRGLSIALTSLALAGLMLVPGVAQADFGFLPGNSGFHVTATSDVEGEPATLAGSHPFSLITDVNFNQVGEYSDGDLKDLELDLPAGLIENPTSVNKCTAAQFATPRVSPFEQSLSSESCPATSQIGVVTLKSSYGAGETRTFGIFNLAPPPGFPSQFGFAPYGVPVTITPHVRETGSEYGLTLQLTNLSQQLNLTGFKMEIWGTPWAISHDTQRGNCLNEVDPSYGHAKCSIEDLKPSHPSQAYLTLPTSCEGPLSFHIRADAWYRPGTVAATSTGAQNEAMADCDALTFAPVPRGVLSTNRTTTPTGYDFSLDGNSAPLINPATRASSQIKKAVLSLPEGMTVNPSVAAGLGTCSEAEYAAESITSAPGAGCPNVSKVGELIVESPIVEGPIEGSMFFASPHENRFGTLLALYLVAKAPERGLLIKVAGRVDADPETGRLTATFDDLPQLPYSHFNVNFREGQRSPLATPSVCGNYASELAAAPWRDPTFVLHESSPFSLSAGVGGGPCPQGLPPFTPQSEAGTLNSNASAYSPFYLHLTRTDPEQEITSYSAALPPGLLGKIAGVPFCSEADIEAAKGQTGAESATVPACPAASLIGHTYTGYGVGSTLSYAPGTLYLAGPYHGSPLSVVAIDSAKIGPFDLGTVVIRSAIRINSQTAQVSIDSAGSDPIPHILDGFPLRLRDIRIYIDKPKLMVNPTSCDPFAVTSTLTGAGARFSDPSDDSNAAAPTPFQASNCSGLGFAPQLSLTLKGRHERGDNPTLKAVVRPRLGDANIGKATVTLPPKIFLAQENIETICTPKQFATENCPKGSIYGTASAVTPLMDEPLTGNVYLRGNNRSASGLPDLVAYIGARGIKVEVVGSIDSRLGGLRARFDVLPDAPVTKFRLTLRGGERGIITNATDVCLSPQVATAKFIAQDNAVSPQRIRIKSTSCGKKKSGKAKRGKR